MPIHEDEGKSKVTTTRLKEEYFDTSLLYRNFLYGGYARGTYEDGGDPSALFMEFWVETQENETGWSGYMAFTDFDDVNEGGVTLGDVRFKVMADHLHFFNKVEVDDLHISAIHLVFQSYVYPRVEEMMEGTVDGGQVHQEVEKLEEKYGEDRESWPEGEACPGIVVISADKHSSRCIIRTIHVDKENQKPKKEDPEEDFVYEEEKDRYLEGLLDNLDNPRGEDALGRYAAA